MDAAPQCLGLDGCFSCWLADGFGHPAGQENCGQDARAGYPFSFCHVSGRNGPGCIHCSKIGNLIAQPVTSVFASPAAKISETIIFFFAVLLGGLLAAEASFLFGLPIFTLGSDYFGIATLGFTIIIKVLLDNTDTMLGFE